MNVTKCYIVYLALHIFLLELFIRIIFINIAVIHCQYVERERNKNYLELSLWGGWFSSHRGGGLELHVE